MKTITWITSIVMAFLLQFNAWGQENSRVIPRTWQVGIGLGELPVGGSFKPSITLGYHFNEKIYAGFIYQFKDEIQRSESSFNAQSAELDGLMRSMETVNQRFMLQVRYTPVRFGPYISAGFVYNGRDTENMFFDNRSRNLVGENFEGSIHVQQSRPAGWGLALGLGYQYHFKNGFTAGFEWTPAWGQRPDPEYQFGGTANLSSEAQAEIQKNMNEGFENSVTNLYKVFHIGFAYRFPLKNP
ncbi:outer membrane beta-barrel protein [bacterium SCSIO 12741]|nr:outer membrane beta-barrel protein [bacterium SCSIO 12741]